MQVMVLTIICSVVGGGALLKFIEFLIKRDDDKDKSKNEYTERFDTLDKKMDDLNKKIEYVSADNARIRILNFSEEIQRGHKHSKEAFDQVHSDIDRYAKHCVKYPEYPNSRADMAIKHIENIYIEALKLEKDGKEGFLS